MDCSPTLDQQRWVDHAARFAAEELRPFADDWGCPRRVPGGVLSARRRGRVWPVSSPPPRWAGQGLDTLTACMVYEALARARIFTRATPRLTVAAIGHGQAIAARSCRGGCS